MTTTTQTTNLMTDIDKHFDMRAAVTPVRYISADEMAYLRARAVTLRSEASWAIFKTMVAKFTGLFHSRPAAWTVGSTVTAE
ncbi:MAG: hypothetical protein OJJ21_18615 [Ferrovibrio sp.]|uniref:RSP_7527 family protein n=1 Tax=Ferrovibrio sp. TaxID=1917215 RepID=UPI0026270566|nr:hypothetical protein [Ferrovibrio sp.]MCW0235621.1 hypothetical protein [Ferrovibrio sp.]